MAEPTKVKHLVVDSGAFIRGTELHEIGENIYSIQEVVNEIRDKATRERLQFLPYELKLKQPPEEDIKAISNFSKKTGDYASLSAVDIKIMALAHYLERVEMGSVDHLNKEPTRGRVVANKPGGGTITQLAGFYCPKGGQDNVGQQEEAKAGGDESEKENDSGKEPQPSEQPTTTEEKEIDQNESKVGEDEAKDKQEQPTGEENSPEVPEEEEEEAGEAGQDDDTWITPVNIEQIKSAMMALGIKESNEPRPAVALITTDYAIQNCMLQLGLKIVSTDGGRLIRETRQFVLRCHACFKVVTNLDRKFCPGCGNLRTLKRVAMTVNERGEKTYHINYRRPINIRGLRYSLPAPQGGKHSNNPVLVEDQPIPQHKASKFALQQKKNAAGILGDPDLLSGSNPFAINDVYSRASRHKNLPGKANSHVGPRINPNATRRPTGNRKKKSSKD